MNDGEEKVTSLDFEEICQKIVRFILEQCDLVTGIKYEVHMPDQKMLLTPCVSFEFFLSGTETVKYPVADPITCFQTEATMTLNTTMIKYKIICFITEDVIRQLKNYEFMRGFVRGITDDIYKYYERIK